MHMLHSLGLMQHKCALRIHGTLSHRSGGGLFHAPPLLLLLALSLAQGRLLPLGLLPLLLRLPCGLPSLQRSDLRGLVLLLLQAVHCVQVAAVRLQGLGSKDAVRQQLLLLILCSAVDAAAQQAVPSALEGLCSLCFFTCTSQRDVFKGSAACL